MWNGWSERGHPSAYPSPLGEDLRLMRDIRQLEPTEITTWYLVAITFKVLASSVLCHISRMSVDAAPPLACLRKPAI